MAKVATEFVCSNCGRRSPKLMGRCPNCGEFNTMQQVQAEKPALQKTIKREAAIVTSTKPTLIAEVDGGDLPRIELPQMPELNRVLGGGLVPGSLILIGGEPGIGKTTLVSQVSAQLAGEYRVLYVSAEESPAQVKMRMDRLGIAHGEVYLYSQPCLERIAEQIDAISPDVLVIDSIQTIFSEVVDSIPGNPTQVKECAHKLQMIAKHKGVTVIIIGHVTKDGQIAGPQTLAHVVDAVFSLEDANLYRIMRANKNRFGTVNDVAIYRMTGEGMIEVLNPSADFIAERDPDASGSVITVTMEGTRPLLVELQALVTPGTGGSVRRMANGVDYNRMIIVASVLGKAQSDLHLYEKDIVTNVVGGLRIFEPAADVGMALAMWSSAMNTPIPEGWIAIGELGLSGELRSVTQMETRLREAAKLGFTNAIIPAGSHVHAPQGMNLHKCRNVSGALYLMDRISGETEDDEEDDGGDTVSPYVGAFGVARN